MKYRYLLLGLAALVVSCSVEEVRSPEFGNYDSPVFYATIEEQYGTDTKVYADENLKVLWNEGDLISIFDKKSGNDEYCFQGETGDNAGAFKRVKDFSEEGVSLDAIYAVYPYSRATTMERDGLISLTLPAEQSYLEGSFGLGANTMVSATENNRFRFMNVGGYLGLRLYGEDVTVSSIVLYGNDGESLSGQATVEMSVGGIPALTMDKTAGKRITIVCDPPVQLGSSSEDATFFWVVMPPTVFQSGFSLDVHTTDDALFKKRTTKSVTIGRSSITCMQPLKVTPAPVTSIEVTEEDLSYEWYFDENESYIEDAFSDPASFFIEPDENFNILIRDFDRMLMSYSHMEVGSSLDYWVLDDTYDVEGVVYHRARLKTPIPYFFLTIVNYDGSNFVINEVLKYHAEEQYPKTGSPNNPVAFDVTHILLVDDTGHLMLYVLPPSVNSSVIVVSVTCEEMITKEELDEAVLNDLMNQLFLEPLQNGIEISDILSGLLMEQSWLDYSVLFD